ncbi:Threonine/homoserine/homoserine lactone efflux protein [Cohaesibacter sp. ES.047]|uniref:LysE family translocator n=1 Tax=Cohaesibacter sp. ES.047 TaxID=1798205 RepID=UPI000BB76EEB|nr:LysE family translocator [Cohaesibacter sp. ES.047]SNY93139.1 Threonine/homoserine/homoserine lactone efflux protein [Cohaesibacter sp. ES.047]
MVQNLVLLLLAALPLMGSPGPATLSLASLGSAFGFTYSVRYLLGIILGTNFVLLIVATGLTAVITAQPTIFAGLQLLAGTYILYLAYRIATAPTSGGAKPQPMETASRSPLSFWGALGLATTNPKAYAAIGAVYGSHSIFPANFTLDVTVKILTLGSVIVVVNTIWLAFGAAFSRHLQSPRIGRAINVTFAVMLIASVGIAVWPN